MSALRHALDAVLDYAEKIGQENDALLERIAELESLLVVKSKDRGINLDMAKVSEIVKSYHKGDCGIVQDIQSPMKSTFNPNLVPGGLAKTREAVPVGGSNKLDWFSAKIGGQWRLVELLAYHGGFLKVRTVDDQDRECFEAIKICDVNDTDSERVAKHLEQNTAK